MGLTVFVCGGFAELELLDIDYELTLWNCYININII